MASGKCICGCNRTYGLTLHHAIYQQELRRIGMVDGLTRDHAKQIFNRLRKDKRGMVPVHGSCHAAHHNRSRPLHLCSLTNEVYEFASEVMGPGRAYEYLKRRYRGDDPRLDALLTTYETEDEHGRAA